MQSNSAVSLQLSSPIVPVLQGCGRTTPLSSAAAPMVLGYLVRRFSKRMKMSGAYRSCCR